MRNNPLRLLIPLVIIFSCPNAFSQLTARTNPELLKKTWDAEWITCPGISGSEYGVYLFRKAFQLDVEKDSFIVNVSADNRYKLYVNGQYVCNGPARGDELNWRFETVDISTYLKRGKNVIAAIVWNFAEWRPLAQHTSHTGFILQGNTKQEEIVNSGESWRVHNDTAYTALLPDIKEYYVVGPGEEFNANLHPWNWTQVDFNDFNWEEASKLRQGKPLKSFGHYGSPTPHVLVPRTIPLMEEKQQRFASIRRTGISHVPDQFLTGNGALTIPPNTKVKILFDHGNLTNAYPELIFSKGKNSKIKLTYAESLFTREQEKGNRNEIDQKEIKGNFDSIVADGGDSRTYQTLWWRTFRYLEMEVETKHESLIINDFYSIFTGYPFVEKAVFDSDLPVLKEIWKAGWRTQRLCAGETFFDCPYYEQLQYVGDTRIQALISTYVSGDTALMRNALVAIHESRLPLGLTQSRYPSYYPQIIPPFSLFWIAMIHDYRMLCEDDALVKSFLPAIMDVLNWFEERTDATGMVTHPEWWNFVDWVNFKHWESGVPPGLHNSRSSIITLQYVYALMKATDLLRDLGLEDHAKKYAALADLARSAVFDQCYDRQKKLIADSPEKTNFSQHANVMAVLTSTIDRESEVDVLGRILSDADIAQCSYYYTFYLAEAMKKSGLGNQYLDMIGPWEQMLDLGLTTFAETPDPTRSDCHAWSSSPLYFFLSLVCGIQPDEPGFRSVRIAPNPGSLNYIDGAMPHRSGMIRVKLDNSEKEHISGEVVLPENLTGIFIWKGQIQLLNGGVNTIGF